MSEVAVPAEPIPRPVVRAACLIVAAALLLATAYGKWEDAPVPSPNVGAAAPDFTLPGARGGQLSLRQCRGRWAIVVFWAPWSPPGAAMAHALDEAAAALPADVALVGVALDYVDASEVTELTGPASPRVTHLLGRPSELERWGSFPILPVTYLLDPSGHVQTVRHGFIDGRTLRALAVRRS